MFGDAALSAAARKLIEDADNRIFLSMVSVWEMAIKTSLGKLPLVQPFPAFLSEHLQRNSIELLPIGLPHVLRVERLPLHHRDPFDRLIIAQSLVEAMPILSADAIFDSYGVTRLA